MHQPRLHQRTEAEYIRAGFELFVFHERETGAECEVYARTVGEAKRKYRAIVERRRVWVRRNRDANLSALRPFLEKRAERLRLMRETAARAGEVDFDDLTFFDITEGVDSVPDIDKNARKLRGPYNKKAQHSDDGSVQLELF